MFFLNALMMMMVVNHYKCKQLYVPYIYVPMVRKGRFLLTDVTFGCHLPLTDDYFRLSKQQMKLEEFVVLNVVITSTVSRLW